MAKNVDIINAILNGMSDDAKANIPAVTQANMAELGSALLDNPNSFNQFLVGLVDRIAFSFVSSKAYENPLKALTKGNVPFGKTIQEIFVNKIKAQEYDVEDAEQTLFKRHLPEVSAIYHTLNRQDMYPTTVELMTLRQAFLEQDGLQKVIDEIIMEMTSSDEDDTFLLTKNLMNIYGVEGRFYNVTIPAPIDEATVRNAVVQIKAVSNDMTFRKTKFNNAGVRTHTKKNNQVLFVDSYFDAQVDVELLAQAFNMSKAEFNTRKIVVDDFGGLPNVVAILADEDWLQIWDNLNETRTADNGKGLYTNYFRHHWQTLSTSRFSNAVIFTSVAPTLASIDVTPATATVAKKGTQQFDVVPTGTNLPPSGVTWSHDGNSERTFVSPTGLLYVGSDETQNPLTVTATSTFDALITDTAVVTVV